VVDNSECVHKNVITLATTRIFTTLDANYLVTTTLEFYIYQENLYALPLIDSKSLFDHLDRLLVNRPLYRNSNFSPFKRVKKIWFNQSDSEYIKGLPSGGVIFMIVKIKYQIIK
jgi:hypothetical protein